MRSALSLIFYAFLGILCPVRLAGAAETSNHWAFRPLRHMPLPGLQNPTWCRTPVDLFVLDKLEHEGLHPSAEASKRTLLRRVYQDLIGLPPTPEEVAAFLADFSTDAYEKVVDRLLNSPRHGERWARHWMDAAHFAETHGHDQDRMRTNAWPYRDYLVRSFNSDKPYARFVQEQVAGDVLFPDEPQATVALGFLAAGPWDESSLRDIREDTLDRQAARYIDRDDIVTTVMQTFTSTTVQCARCHDHKFDPIPQADYYALQAVFAGVERANRYYDRDVSVARKRRDLLAAREQVEHGDAGELLAPAAQADAAAWESHFKAAQSEWRPIVPQTYVSMNGATLERLDDASVLSSGVRPERDVYTITAGSPLTTISVVRLELLTHTNLPFHGPGRQDNANLHLSEFQVLLFDPKSGASREIPLARATADFEEAGQAASQTLDRNEKTDWGIFPKTGEVHQAVFELKEPIHVPAGGTLVFLLKQLYGGGHLIGRARLSVAISLTPGDLRPLPPDLERIVAKPAADRSRADKIDLARAVALRRLEAELASLPKPSLVYAAGADFVPDGNLKPVLAPRPIHMLKRGEVTKPLEEAFPGALKCVPDLPARFTLTDSRNEGVRRAALAHWLTQTNNLLTWRSIVNRVWHHHFGRGLVATPNDFGKMGAVPSHPELLDWLAIWFRDEAHGSLKALHRFLVTSAVYRQDSHSASSADPDNHLLSRMQRARLDAEQVRDAILQISGRLDLRMGGPSDLQFDVQPGIHVTPKVDYSKFDVDSTASHRRGVYRFIFRTLPDPFMDALDCPAGDQLTPVRNASVTVQQALALWNDAFVARYAEHFAARLAVEAPDLESRITRAFELALNRPATASEVADFARYARQHGLANFCRVLINSNEFMFLN